MIDKETARNLVLEHINSRYAENLRERTEPLVLIDEATIEQPHFWVFFYTTKRYTEIRNRRDDLLGNAPIIVEKSDGSIHMTGTALPTEHYIADYEAERQ